MINFGDVCESVLSLTHYDFFTFNNWNWIGSLVLFNKEQEQTSKPNRSQKSMDMIPIKTGSRFELNEVYPDLTQQLNFVLCFGPLVFGAWSLKFYAAQNEVPSKSTLMVNIRHKEVGTCAFPSAYLIIKMAETYLGWGLWTLVIANTFFLHAHYVICEK